MPHAIEMKDGKILTPFGIRDLLEAVSDYAGEELAREIESYINTNVERWERGRAKARERAERKAAKKNLSAAAVM